MNISAHLQFSLKLTHIISSMVRSRSTFLYNSLLTCVINDNSLCMFSQNHFLVFLGSSPLFAYWAWWNTFLSFDHFVQCCPVEIACTTVTPLVSDIHAPLCHSSNPRPNLRWRLHFLISVIIIFLMLWFYFPLPKTFFLKGKCLTLLYNITFF